MANILIADTDPNIREILSEVLKPDGHILFEADDGTAATGILRRNPIDIILADRSLPVDDDAEALTLLRGIAPKAYIILMTGLDEEDSQNILGAGAYAVISKPFDIEQIHKTIREVSHQSESIRTKRELMVQKEKKKKTLKTSILSALISLIVVGGGGFLFDRFRPRPFNIYSISHENISGITFDGKNIWGCDWFSQSIHRYRLDALLSVDRSWSFKGWNPFALAWDGHYIWSANSWKKKIARHRIGEKLEIDREFPSPVQEASGLHFDGDSYWICDPSEARIVQFVVDGESLKVLQSFHVPGERPVGVYRNERHLWTADSKTGTIYQCDIEQDFKVTGIFVLPDNLRGRTISCFSSDGDCFWIVIEEGHEICQIHPRYLKPIKSR